MNHLGLMANRKGITMSETKSANKQFWFLDTLVLIRVSEYESSDGISVLEHKAPFGDSPPLHQHRTEDEIFHILEGQFRFKIGEKERSLGSGNTLLAPKGIPHTYLVESPEGGCWLTVTDKGDFEQFICEVGRRTDRLELPEPGGEPTPEMKESLAVAASKYEIDIVGPPLAT